MAQIALCRKASSVFVGVASSHDPIAARCRSHRKKPNLLEGKPWRAAPLYRQESFS
jgi:hypothetical protein